MKKEKKAAGPLKDLYRQSACLANQLAEAIYTSADTQRGQELSQMLQDGNYSGIVSASIDPKDYGRSNVDTFSRDYLCVELMSKFPSWELGIDRHAVALRKFSEVEEDLKVLSLSANQRFVSGIHTATLHAIEHVARRKIAKILGEADINEIHSFFAFGPGASTSLSRRRSDAAFKFGALRPQLTYNAIPLAEALRKAHPTWHFDAEVVSGSKLVTVPKNAKTDRVICIEPDLNMYFQKGLGSVMRKRLQRYGLLKSDAQQYNAELAQEGSYSGKLATVDLSSASDSIHYGLVALLPPSWQHLIELTRSPMTVLPSGEKILLRKVSSMGNGFTFELETLIFYSLCQAVIELFPHEGMDRRCTVFGDDIIIASELVPVLSDVLFALGFTTNKKKTFANGLFRESCGKHYFNGSDVTPFYVRQPIDSVLRKYWAANTIKRYSRLSWGLDPSWHQAYKLVVDSIPTYFQGFKIPEGKGDGGLVCDWDEVCPPRSKYGLDSWEYKDIVPVNRPVKLDSMGRLLRSLHVLEFPREVRDVNRDEVSLKIAILAGSDRNIRQALHSSLSEDAIEEIGLLLAQSRLLAGGVSELVISDAPNPIGYKVHSGRTQRWPSFGPWLIS